MDWKRLAHTLEFTISDEDGQRDAWIGSARFSVISAAIMCILGTVGALGLLWSMLSSLPPSSCMNPQAPTTTHARALLHLVRQDNLDAAIDAGLMAWAAHADDGLEVGERALLAAARERLRTAWTARERVRARKVRLERHEYERRARRAASAPPPASPTPSSPALPTAAAAILARARLRAGAGVVK